MGVRPDRERRQNARALNAAQPRIEPGVSTKKEIEAYRGIYYGAPISTKANPSVVAVAELMVEMGRLFGDNGILRSPSVSIQFSGASIPAASIASTPSSPW